MERFMRLQILEGFKRKITYKAMQDLEDHFPLSYREVEKNCYF